MDEQEFESGQLAMNNEVGDELSTTKLGGNLGLSQIPERRFDLKIESEKLNINALGLRQSSVDSFITQTLSQFYSPLSNSESIKIELTQSPNNGENPTDGETSA